MSAQPSGRRLASVQRHYVRAREIMGEVLCLSAPLSPSKRSYRAVLEVSSLNFLLKAEEEQEALIERYRSLLKALTFPLQVVVRHERLDLRPTVARMRAHLLAAQTPQVPQGPIGGRTEDLRALHAPAEMAKETPAWESLVESLEELLQQISNQRTLIERHWYVIIPAPEAPASVRGLRGRFTRRQARAEDFIARSLQDLSIRVEMVQAQLAALGLRSHRLGGEALAQVYYHCLSPERALRHPLHRLHLASVGHFPQVSSRTRQDEPSALRWPSTDAWQTTRELAERQEPPGNTDPRLPQTRRQARSRRPVPPPDFLRLADLLAPASITETRDWVRVDEEYLRGLAVIAFPREVSASGWLAPLLQLDEILDLCFHLHPQNQAAMMCLLKRRLCLRTHLQPAPGETG